MYMHLLNLKGASPPKYNQGTNVETIKKGAFQQMSHF
jgi:hypothetical protein